MRNQTRIGISSLIFNLDKNTMEEEVLSINKDELKNLSAEELVDLKIELDDILREIDNLIAECDEVL